MRLRRLHDWHVSPTEAASLQRRLREEVVRDEEQDLLRVHELLVAGLDCHFPAGTDVARAAVSVMRWRPSEALLEAVEEHVVDSPASFPYIPGLLSFREVPALAAVLERVEVEPDLLVCRGHGLAHPRRFGLACHVGVLSGLPTIGVAKQRLIGGHGWVDDERGAWQPVLDDSEVIGAVLRTRSWVQPVYVSIGNLISLQSALRAVLALASPFRLPEPARLAHQAAAGN